MEFDYDCLQRHQIRLVRMPSDGVDPSGLNGPCRVYRLGRPMKLTEFKEMPADLQRTYLRRLRQWGAAENSAAAMLGASPEALRLLLKRHHVVLDQPNPTVWSEFVGRGKEA